ncbi:uncharacterized protein LOC130451298 [Diorhabda sublineata]|uniref:uncharacterized protein LOC130451298 n=1 Tax=Diorhabda sublineata TaxID=1163346 RepID=UPI0024E056BC|nr:uncharacterized protein LOC130451298 [Diorhabda sublineata]XP_056646217.1 uncharacterized protein LOC130451298 [Diorhabda sublineata]
MVNTLDTKNGIQELENLKQYFEKVIDSRRIFEKIQSLDDLIRILYKRDCDLQELSNQLKIINDNKTVCKESVSVNISSQQRIFPQLVLQSCRINPQPVLLEQRIDDRTILPNVPQDPIERIDQLIADEIGQKWKDLARNLKIPEDSIRNSKNVPGKMY